MHKPLQEEELVVRMDTDQELVDSFMGAELRWVLMSSTHKNSVSESRVSRDRGASKAETKYFELSFHKKHREMVLKSYLPWILRTAKEIEEGRKMVKLHTVDYKGPDYWGSINLNHPANFDTMAVEPEMKAALMEDLDQFVAGREYYKRVGRAWKRGYLLYGPPGTGKSSLVAAMANYLKYDVYDLDLSEVQCNSDLRRLLIGTGNRSIIVIEDIDCSKESKTLDEEKVRSCFYFVLWDIHLGCRYGLVFVCQFGMLGICRLSPNLVCSFIQVQRSLVCVPVHRDCALAKN